MSHPQLPKNYSRARNAQEKKMTQAVKKVINISKKEAAHNKENRILHKVTSNPHLDKKKRELGYMIIEGRTQGSKDEARRKRTAELSRKNSEKLRKLLKVEII